MNRNLVKIAKGIGLRASRFSNYEPYPVVGGGSCSIDILRIFPYVIISVRGYPFNRFLEPFMLHTGMIWDIIHDDF